MLFFIKKHYQSLHFFLFVFFVVILISCQYNPKKNSPLQQDLSQEAISLEKKGDSCWQVADYFKAIEYYDSSAIYLVKSKAWENAFSLKCKLIHGLDSLDFLDSLNLKEAQLLSLQELIYPNFNPIIDQQLANTYLDFGFSLYYLNMSRPAGPNPAYAPAAYENLNRAYQYFSKQTGFPADSLEVIRQHIIIHSLYQDKHYNVIHQGERLQEYLEETENIPRMRINSNHLGIAYAYTESYQKAEKYFFRAYDMHRSSGDTLSLAYVNKNNNLGKLYYDLFKPEQSFTYLESALKVIQHISKNDSSALPGLMALKADTYDHLGIAWHKTFLTSMDKVSNKTKEEYLNHALQYTDSALHIRDKLFKQDLGAIIHYKKIALIHIHKGYYYIDKKNYTQSLLHFQKAINLLKVLPIDSQQDFPLALRAIGRVYYEKGEYQKALFFLQKSLIENTFDFDQIEAEITPDANSKHIIDEHFRLAVLYKARVFTKLWEKTHYQKYYELALKNYKIFDEAITKNRRERPYRSDQLELIRSYPYAYGDATVLCIKKRDFEQAFQFSEKSKSAVLYEQISESSVRQYARIPKKLLNDERELKSEMSYYQQELHKLLSLKEEENTKQAIVQKKEKYRNQLYLLDQKLTSLIEQFEENYPDYYNLKYNDVKVSIQDVQKKLLDQETVTVSYVFSETHLAIIAINQDNYQFELIDLQSHDIKRLLDRFKDKISNVGGNFKKDAYDLYKILLAPVEPILKNKKKLMIIPSGALSRVPFEALLDQLPTNSSASPDYLIKKYSIQYYPTLTLAVNAIQKKQLQNFGQELTAFMPVFDHNRDSLENSRSSNLGLMSGKLDLDTLKTSDETLRKLDSLFQRKKLTINAFLRKDAREKVLKTHKINSKFLLFFTHSFADEDPSSSCIALYPEQNQVDQKEDGSLFIEEIFNLNIQSDLVILTSCQSGTGQEFKGEGILSLGRSFMFCGTPNVMQSLWKIQEKSSSEFLITFFNLYLNNKNLTYAQALEKTKLELLKHPVYKHPYYWSPIVLISAQLSTQ